MFKRKSSSAVLLGSAAASMAACSAQNTAKASLNIYFDILDEWGKRYGSNVAGLCKNFTWKNYVVDALKLPWSIYRWLSYDSWVSLFAMKEECATNPIALMFLTLGMMMFAFVWLAVQAGVIYSVYSGIEGALKYSKKRRNQAILKEMNKNKLNVDEFAKKKFNKEDFLFIEKIREKYGKEYSNSLKESFLYYSLGGNENSCEKYFKDFVLDHPESDEYFKSNRDNAEKDYGLIGPKVVTEEDKKFIDKELPKLTDELGFLKEKGNLKKDEDIFKNFRKSYVEYCHLCNSKRSRKEKEKDNGVKTRNSLTAKEYFFGAYMNKIPAKEAIKGFPYLVSGGNDYSVSKYWSEKDKSYGLKYKSQYSKQKLNYVGDEEYNLFNAMLRKASLQEETKNVKNCFREYVLYLHDCNKNFEKSEKNFKNFCKDKNISLEKLDLNQVQDI